MIDSSSHCTFDSWSPARDSAGASEQSQRLNVRGLSARSPRKPENNNQWDLTVLVVQQSLHMAFFPNFAEPRLVHPDLERLLPVLQREIGRHATPHEEPASHCTDVADLPHLLACNHTLQILCIFEDSKLWSGDGFSTIC